MESKSEIQQAIAAELRAAKGAAKVPVRVLVELTGIPTATMNRYLNGERDIRMSQFYLITDALNVSPVRLVERAIERAKEERDAAIAAGGEHSNVTQLRPLPYHDMDTSGSDDRK